MGALGTIHAPLPDLKPGGVRQNTGLHREFRPISEGGDLGGVLIILSGKLALCLRGPIPIDDPLEIPGSHRL